MLVRLEQSSTSIWNISARSFAASNGSTSFIFDAKVMTSPVSPQPKQVKILFLRSIENDGVFSL